MSLKVLMPGILTVLAILFVIVIAACGSGDSDQPKGMDIINGVYQVPWVPVNPPPNLPNSTCYGYFYKMHEGMGSDTTFGYSSIICTE